MATKISYCDETWNPVTGCTKLSAGCQNCYAYKLAPRLKGRFGYDAQNPFAVTLHPDKLAKPFDWKRSKVIFVCSMGDLLHECVPDGWINLVMEVIQNASHHKFLVLTKRATRMNDFFTEYVRKHDSVPENLWVGVSVENQKAANERIPALIDTPVSKRFLSVEPLLERVVLMRTDLRRFINIRWIICGGESGQGARYMHPDWARSVRHEAGFFGIPFYMKQMSRKAPIPSDIDIQQFPQF